MESSGPVQPQLVGGAVWLLLGIAYCFGVTAVARSRGPRQLWTLWAASVIVLVVAAVMTVRLGPFGEEVGAGFLPFYMFSTLLGIPSAGALAFARWRTTKPWLRGLPLESLFTVLVFFVLLPIAMIVAVLPDFLRFWAG